MDAMDFLAEELECSLHCDLLPEHHPPPLGAKQASQQLLTVSQASPTYSMTLLRSSKTQF